MDWKMIKTSDLYNDALICTWDRLRAAKLDIFITLNIKHDEDIFGVNVITLKVSSLRP